MALTTDGQNEAATAVGDAYRWLALSNGQLPGGTETSGGSYARIQVTWNAATGGLRTASGTPVATINVPSGSTVSHWGLYSAVTGGTLGVEGALPASETYGADGTYEVTTLTLDPLAS